MKDKTIAEILEMDVKSDEFFKIYKLISSKYWNFENPDDLQLAAQTLVMFAERFDEDKIVLSHKIIKAVVEMTEEKVKATTGHLVFEDQQYYFDIYESEPQRDELNKMLAKSGKAIKEGNIRVKNKPYGKNYFKK